METIVITGAGTGLGKELALLYAEQGHKLILIGRRKEPLIDVQTKIQAMNGEAYIYPLDITCYEDVHNKVQTILNEHQVTMLVNNAGVGHFGPLEEMTEQQIHEVIDTNVKGTIYVTKAFLPYFKTLPKAKIMNIISTAGLRGKVNESVYVASKFAVRGFTESLIKELEQTNISVTAVYMGGMDTPFWEGSNHIKDRSRLRSPKEVAKTIIAEDRGQAEIIIQ
ncbi:short-subunit dehydrogenase [Thermolongibacillus altinsuensis]|uniref:Short-subunit dehydrogenase n=1 Tax=Thermolongibacillus altinsuensis TaxID=575256 RepID=A0A4R1QB59_9BACL|nr:SDR family NAD(P)-dependent oxidoreductase [Thermolongibacillus altinsuensis]TCL46771.1 short-subunit dehydrogenase [Thermolongibacillus altinsuensis]GMB09295.1 NAD(P)-dependent oxidoreductase [Thermolongibacillus altinsuensis]